MTGKRILIAGSYGQGNAGDEAILAALLGQLRSLLPEAGLVVVSGRPESTQARFGVESVSWADWSAVLEALRRADLLILGGGGIFFDHGDFDPRRLLEDAAPDLAHYATYPLLAWLVDKPLMVYACGAGPLLTEQGREVVRLAFEISAYASVRDPESKRLLAEIGVDPSRVTETVDPAFGLTPAAREQVEPILAGLGLAGEGPVVGLSARPWELGIGQEDWERSLAAAVAPFARALDARLLLIPCNAEDEPCLRRIKAAAELAGMAEGDVALAGSGHGPDEIAGLIGCCDLLVGLRLHSILFAVLTGTPFVALSYAPKVRSLARQVGHEELCLDLDELADLPRLLGKAWEGRAALRRELRQERARLAAIAAGNAGPARDLLGQGPTSGTERLAPASRAVCRRLAAEAVATRLRELRKRGTLLERQWVEMRQLGDWLEAKKAEVAAAEHRIAELSSQLEARQAELSGQLAARQVELEALGGQVADLRQELEQSQAGCERLRERLDLVQSERDGLARQLAEMGQTAALRLAARYWRAVARLAPEGSRRRKVYRGATAALRRLAAGRSRPPALPSGAQASPAPAAPPPGAPAGDLSLFADQVSAAGAPAVVAIVSGAPHVPRPAELARELARQGIPVVLVGADPEEGPPAQGRLGRGFVQVPLDAVLERPGMLAGAFAGRDRILLCQLPHPGLFELLAWVHAEGWITVYDALADWQALSSAGGAAWYEEAFERHLIRAADAVFAPDAVRAAGVRRLGGAGVQVLPHGRRRLESLLAALERGDQRVAEKRALAGSRR